MKPQTRLHPALRDPLRKEKEKKKSEPKMSVNEFRTLLAEHNGVNSKLLKRLVNLGVLVDEDEEF